MLSPEPSQVKTSEKDGSSRRSFGSYSFLSQLLYSCGNDSYSDNEFGAILRPNFKKRVNV